MLKIKDSVDLKELEKFGFKKETIHRKEIGYENKYLNFYTVEGKEHEKLELNLHMGGCLNTRLMLDCVYDLIQARISRKVLKMSRN